MRPTTGKAWRGSLKQRIILPLVPHEQRASSNVELSGKQSVWKVKAGRSKRRRMEEVGGAADRGDIVGSARAPCRGLLQSAAAATRRGEEWVIRRDGGSVSVCCSCWVRCDNYSFRGASRARIQSFSSRQLAQPWRWRFIQRLYSGLSSNSSGETVTSYTTSFLLELW